MLSQNFTVSQLSLKMTTAFSPILYLPMLSLSTASNFYFSKISSSYSFSPFISGHKFNFLSVKYSQFSYYLSNGLRINGDEPVDPPFTPVFQKNCIRNAENTTIQVIGCFYKGFQDSGIYSKNANLSVFITDFENCMAKLNGGGIYHENGYLRTDSNNFIHCNAPQYGGGFYHKAGPIKIYRSSFNFNTASKEGGYHFCVEDYGERTLRMDYCFFSYISVGDYDCLIRVRASVTFGKPILVTPSNCRFNFTKEELEKYVNNFSYTELVVVEDGDKDSNKYAPPNTFYGDTFPMRVSSSGTFTPTLFFSPTEYFSQSTIFTLSDCFSQSTIFVETSPFTPSTDFTNTNTFTPSSGFSSSIGFTSSIQFTQSQVFSQSSHFSQSNDFLASVQFSSSSPFTPSSAFTLTGSFTPHRTRTPSYSPIPTRSGGPVTPAFSPSSSFTASSAFTPSSDFLPSNFIPTDYFGLNRATKRSLKGGSIMITLIVLGALLLLLGLIANIILCVQMVQAGEIIITQRM